MKRPSGLAGVLCLALLFLATFAGSYFAGKKAMAAFFSPAPAAAVSAAPADGAAKPKETKKGGCPCGCEKKSGSHCRMAHCGKRPK